MVLKIEGCRLPPGPAPRRARPPPPSRGFLRTSPERAESAAGRRAPQPLGARRPPRSPGRSLPAAPTPCQSAASPPREPARGPISASCDVATGPPRTQTPPRSLGRGHREGRQMSTALRHSLPAPGVGAGGGGAVPAPRPPSSLGSPPPPRGPRSYGSPLGFGTSRLPACLALPLTRGGTLEVKGSLLNVRRSGLFAEPGNTLDTLRSFRFRSLGVRERTHVLGLPRHQFTTYVQKKLL